MGISRKGVCPSPLPYNSTQRSLPPSRRGSMPDQASTVLPVQGPITPPAQGLITLPAQGQRRTAPPAQLQILTMNVNAWRAFRDKWTTEGIPAEIQSAHVVLIQEHKLVTDSECDDATEWCAARGFWAVFKPACKLESGRASCGVAILVAQRDDFGVTEPQLELTEEESPRIMALQLVVPQMDPLLLVNVYFEDSRGLSILNRQLLARLAIWQQELSIPVLGGGDFNIPSDQIIRSAEFWERARLTVIAPRHSGSGHHHRLLRSVVHLG